MLRESARSRNPAGHSGLIDNAVGLVTGLFAYVESRSALFAAEAKGVVLKLALVIGLAVAALIALVFGYIFVLASAVFGIAHATGVAWTWIALGAGFLHIVLAVVFVLIAKSHLHGRVFPETRTELNKDRQWLKTLNDRNRR